MNEDTKPMYDWLENCYPKESTRKTQKTRFESFLKWANKTPKQLVEEFEQKQARSLILKYQNYLSNEKIVQKGRRKGEKGLMANAVRSFVNPVRAFYSEECETVKKLKRRILKAQIATNEHVFSLSDLQKIWHVCNTRDKAIIACGASLGWEVSAFLAMKREFFERLVKRARSEDLDFIAFDFIREKTNTTQYGILTPCAIDSLERWLEHEDSKKGLWNGLTIDGLNKRLKSLVKEANITTIGSIRWHLLRKWLYNVLARNGMIEDQRKLILGKSIGLTDLTYMPTLKQDAFDKFKQIYPLAMSLVSYSNHKRKDESVKEMIATLTRALVGLYEQQKAKETTHGRVQLEPIKTTKAYSVEVEEEEPTMLSQLKAILALVES